MLTLCVRFIKKEKSTTKQSPSKRQTEGTSKTSGQEQSLQQKKRESKGHRAKRQGKRSWHESVLKGEEGKTTI